MHDFQKQNNGLKIKMLTTPLEEPQHKRTYR